MQRKIGILTFHNVPNYGAALQAYALKSYLESISEDPVSVIDYKGCGNGSEFEPDNVLNSYCKSSTPVKTLIKKIFYSVKLAPDYRKKYKKFEKFRNDFLRPDRIENIEQYDMLFYGSDQIWNPEITNGYDEIFFARFPNSDKIKNIAYSASCGDMSIIEKYGVPAFLGKLKNFDEIGVREKSLQQFLADNRIQSVQTVDPSFLISKEQYCKLLNIKDEPHEKYIFVYELHNNKLLETAAKAISERLKCKIVTVYGNINYSKHDSNNVFNAGPIEFIKYIAGAEYVLTNSFHGMAFSLIFKKNFNIVLPPTRTSRITDLLNQINSEDRIITKETDICTESIDYSKVEPLLSEKIDQSKNYINKAIFGNINE